MSSSADKMLKETLALLASRVPAAIDGRPPAVLETHISRVLLAGPYAFKLKRPVRLPYLDFSTPEARLHACQREFDLNRVNAPQLYLSVCRITRATGGMLEIDGDGPLVDAAIKMRRFNQSDLFNHLVDVGPLPLGTIALLAKVIAEAHERAPVSPDPNGAFRMERVLDLNATSFLSFPELTIFPAVDTVLRQRLRGHCSLLDRRAMQSKVRRCHGDLHLGNICLLDGKPVLFDCLEFDDELATTDVLYDLAFPLMDLLQRDRPAYANALFNRYLDERDEDDGVALLPFFMAVRSCVRSLVLAQKTRLASATTEANRRAASTATCHYLEVAKRLLRPVAPQLVAIGGFSGAGKSSVAAVFAHRVGCAPGARILNTDRIRKQLYGVAPEQRLPEAAYQCDVSDRVYRSMLQRARVLLNQGCSALLDGVFDLPNRRRDAESLAKDLGLPFNGYWLHAPMDVRLARVHTRMGNVSDATTRVLMARGSGDLPVPGWVRVDATAGIDVIAAQISSDLTQPPHATVGQ